jgi:uncharacterized protein
MKYLVLLLIATIVVWRFRSKNEQQNAPSTHEQVDAAPKAVEMQACTHCGLHMPSADLIAGVHGHYCSAEHHTIAEL